MFDDQNEDRPKSNKEIEKLPVYKKAVEINALVKRIVEAVDKTDIEPEEDEEDAEFQSEWIESSLHYLTDNAMSIPSKIAEAEFNNIYDKRMQNAATIRKSAKDLIMNAGVLQLNGYQDTEYLDLLRNEIDVFRVLFAEWVLSFNITNYRIDRWGLFNPPGVNYDDHDPDHDLPFNPNTFLNFLGEFDKDDEEENEDEEDTDFDMPF